MAMTLRLSDEEADALRAQAERENRSMQEVAREAIRVYVSRRVQLREQALRHIVDEDRDLLDRLAK
ncbi:MAG: ribbon-helix-helix protein, CopG family [Pseudonocardiaceae bacterium]